MRKNRGWDSNEAYETFVSNPTGLTYQLQNSLLYIKWVAPIGCITNYKIYAGNEENNLTLIGETNNTFFYKQLTSEISYFVQIKSSYQNKESQGTDILKVEHRKIANKIIVKQPDPIIVVEKNNVEKLEPIVIPIINEKKVTSDFPFGLCSCCNPNQPLMKSNKNVVCSRKNKKIYIQQGTVWVKQENLILSDVEEMDRILRENSAYVGMGGVLLNKN